MLAAAFCAYAAVTANWPSQTGNIQNFQPTLNHRGLATVRAASTDTPWTVTGGITTVYARDPLVLIGPERSRTTVVVDRLDLIVGANFALWSGIEVGVLLPLVAFQNSRATWDGNGYIAQHTGDAGLGDAVVQNRIQILETKSFGFDLAFVHLLSLPVATVEHAGQGMPTFAPELAFSRHLGPWLLAANLGYRWTPGKLVPNGLAEHEMQWRAGVGLSFGLLEPKDTLVTIEGFGRTAAAAPFMDTAKSPTEAIVSARFRYGMWSVSVGGGAGLVNGIGAPLFRAFVGITLRPALMPPVEPPVTVAARETQKDNVAPLPVPANDEPDPVLEHDNSEQRENDISENAGPEDGDVENNGDHEENAQGTLAGSATPPWSTGDMNADMDSPGKVDKFAKAILFDRGQIRLKPEARSALKRIAAMLAAHPELLVVRIEGHADRSGPGRINRVLSRRRAQRVRRFLINQGVQPQRLRAVGYGERRPSFPGPARFAKYQNRRVSFAVVRREPADDVKGLARPFPSMHVAR